MAERRIPAPLPSPDDELLEALVELARSAIRNDAERRGKLTVVQGRRRGGRAA